MERPHDPFVAMVLCAGLGTRLRPLTEELPKPLFPVGDQPMLAHVLERLRRGGVARAVVNTFHLADALSPALAAAMPLPIVILREAVLLGTAGGVAHAADPLGEGDVIVWNGDILADLDVSALFEARRGALAALAFAPRPRGEGTLGVGAAGEVTRLRGETFGVEVGGGDFVGVQVLGEELRRRLPASGCLVGDGYLPALRAGQRVATLPVAGAWDDIGSIDSYLGANARWLAARGLDHWVGPGASTASGVDLGGSIVGAGARISGAGSLRRCVVWPGAAARAPLEDAVVTSSGTIAREGPRGAG